MFVRWKNYTHGVGGTITEGVHGFGIRREEVKNQGGDIIGFDEIWDINGRLYDPSGDWSSMVRRIAALEAAYATGGGDLLLTTDGHTPTYHTLYNRDCKGGTRIIKPLQYPTSRGPENVTMRTFTVSVGGRISLINDDTAIQFNENIQFGGGGSDEGLMVNRTHRAVPVLKTRYVPYTAIQQGSATGYAIAPVPPPPLWPQFWKHKGSRPFGYDRGEPLGYSIINRTVTWRYEFESIYPLDGFPEYW